MKLIIKTLIVLMVTFVGVNFSNCKAQNQSKDFANGDNYLNNNLDKFVGTWKWSNNDDLFILIFKKENIKLPIDNDVRADALIGFHKLVKNGITIEDNTQFIYTNYNENKGSLFTFGEEEKPNLIDPTIFNISRNKNLNMIIEYIDNNHLKITSIKNTPGLKLNFPGKPKFDPTIIYPENIILTKQ
ncbi:hypothetical protein FNJ88_12070 [Chryseobacterium sp. SNU WT5]|uniref:DUF6705 family protein n=1 Tax=Chryseobacterium sp. SNU WT5 TaxID=2594269 RepID=UPI00117F0FF9|nr:DUF6705 family protein [Chryseobacterium sp. SNU WT5]QDP86248.1 hypothetical protein FNJ88_12070 [Chryseobacterium sp. SNU WT5]